MKQHQSALSDAVLTLAGTRTALARMQMNGPQFATSGNQCNFCISLGDNELKS